MTKDEIKVLKGMVVYWERNVDGFGELLRQAFEFLPNSKRGEGIRERWLAALEYSGIQRHREWVERYDAKHRPQIKSLDTPDEPE